MPKRYVDNALPGLFGISGDANRTPVLRIMRPPLRKPKSNPGQTLCQSPDDVAALGQRRDSEDAELAEIVNAWSYLPEPVRAGILAMVRASRTRRSASDRPVMVGSSPKMRITTNE